MSMAADDALLTEAREWLAYSDAVEGDEWSAAPRLIRALVARVEAGEQELARWKICELCGQPMDAPGMCSSGETEKAAGYQLMLDETLSRAEQAEAKLTAADAHRAALRGYMSHKGDCAKWGEVWEYPRHLHPEIECSCGLAALLGDGETP